MPGNGDERKQAPAPGFTWRSEAEAEQEEGNYAPLFWYEKGVASQCEASINVVRRAAQIAHELGHTVAGYRKAFDFLGQAVQIWTAPDERSPRGAVPSQAKGGEAAAEGRSGDPEAERVEAGEDAGGEPDR